MKPPTSFGHSLRDVGRRWWVVVIAVVLVAALAVALPVHRLSAASATTRLHEQDTTVAFSYKGDPQPETASQSVHDIVRSDFIDPAVAETAAQHVGGLTGAQLASDLGMTALTGTDVQLTYTGGSQSNAQRRLAAYVGAFIAARRAQTRRVLLSAATSLQARGGSIDAVKRLQTAADSVNQQIYQVGGISTSPPTRISRSLLIIGGALAGLILGVAVALGLSRADRKIRRLSDLRAAGVHAVPVNADSNATIDALRVLSEVSGVGSDGGVVATCAAHGSSERVAAALGSSFAAAGRSVSLLTASRLRRSDPRDPTDTALPTSPFRSLKDASTAVENRRPGEVYVLSGPGLLDDPEALVSCRVADVTVLIIRRGKTRWAELTDALEILEHQLSLRAVVVGLEEAQAGTAPRPSTAYLRSRRGRTSLAD
jgi:hypothetical protein